MEKELVEALKEVIKAKDELIAELRKEIARLQAEPKITIPNIPWSPPIAPIPPYTPPNPFPWITTSGGSITVDPNAPLFTSNEVKIATEEKTS